MGLQDANNWRWGERINKALRDVESTLAGIWEKTFKTIEAYAGMPDPLVRYLAIEEALQEGIKDTLEHNNQSYDECCAQTDKGKNNSSFSWPYMIVSMIWNTSKLSASHLSRDTAIFVVDCCQFGPHWIFGLKMELMAYASLVGGTTEQRCNFPDLIWYYQWYKTLWNCLH